MDMMVLQLLLPIIGGLLGLLIIIIGWIGNKIHDRLDQINITLCGIERDLRCDLACLDRRITIIETHCQLYQDIKN